MRVRFRRRIGEGEREKRSKALRPARNSSASPWPRSPAWTLGRLRGHRNPRSRPCPDIHGHGGLHVVADVALRSQVTRIRADQVVAHVGYAVRFAVLSIARIVSWTISRLTRSQ